MVMVLQLRTLVIAAAHRTCRLLAPQCATSAESEVVR